jgi:hypothetical protein
MSNRTLVHEAANAPGTNVTFNLAGPAAGKRSFAMAYASGAPDFYVMTDGTQSEWGIGTFTAGSPNTLSRTTVLGNSINTTARLNFTGVVDVYNAVPAEVAVWVGSDYATAVGGTANAITITVPVPLPATIPVGTTLEFIAPSSNTGATTLNANALGTIAVVTPAGAACVGGEIRPGLTRVRYDGTSWRLSSLPAPAMPTASAGVGQFYGINPAVNVGVTLPAGGTWVFHLRTIVSASGIWGSFRATGFAAGGALIASPVPTEQWDGFAWRIA